MHDPHSEPDGGRGAVTAVVGGASPSDSGSPLGAALWGLVALAATAAVSGLEPSLLEEGLHLHVAERLAGGDHIFRDIASFTGPLPFELLGLLFRIFGSEIFVARAAIATLHAVACACTFDLVRRSHHSGAHLAAAIVAAQPIVFFPLAAWYWYTTVCLHLCAVAAWLAQRGLHSPGHAFATGLSVAGVALSKQTVGLVLSIALLAVFAAVPRPDTARRKIVAAYLGGGAAATLVVLGFYGLRGDLGAMVEQMVLWPLDFETTFSVPLPNFWPPGRVAAELPNPAYYLPSLYTVEHGGMVAPGFWLWLLTQLLFLLPFVAPVVTPCVAFLRRLPPAAWIQTAVLVAFDTHMFPRSDWGHICYVLPIAFVLLVLLMPMRTPMQPEQARAAPERSGPGRTLRALAHPTHAAAMAVVAAAAGLAAWLHGLAGDLDYGPRVPLRPVSLAARQVLVPKTIAYLREHLEPGEAIFVARSEPLLYWATGAENPTPYVGVIPGFKDEQQRVILAGLERVRFAAVSDIDQPLYLYYRDELPLVQAYFERHFRVVRRIPPGWLTLLERVPDTGPTAIDLFERAAEGRYWVRERDGQRVVSDPDVPVLVTVQNRRPLAFPLGERGGGVDFELTLPDGPSNFQGGAGLRHIFGLTKLHQHPQRSDLVVSIRAEGSDRFEAIASRTLAIDERRGWRWLSLEADLSRWQGQRVWLRLELRSGDTIHRGRRLAWWGSPRVALPVPDGGKTHPPDTQAAVRR